MANPSTPPLVQPPPPVGSEEISYRHWMQNIYAYLATTKNSAIMLANSPTTTTAASIDFASILTGPYTTYRIIITDMFSTTSAGQPSIRFSTNGSTFDSTANHYISQTVSSNSTTVTGKTLSSTQFVLSGTQQMGTTVITSFSGDYLITNPLTTTGYCRIHGLGSIEASASSLWQESFTGQYPVTGTAVTGLQILGTAGTIRGDVKIYGIL